jgi:hypothetical protein
MAGLTPCKAKQTASKHGRRLCHPDILDTFARENLSGLRIRRAPLTVVGPHYCAASIAPLGALFHFGISALRLKKEEMHGFNRVKTVRQRMLRSDILEYSPFGINGHLL